MAHCLVSDRLNLWNKCLIKICGVFAQPVFLVDTEEYRGISREFEPLQGLVTKRLVRQQSLQSQWMSEQAIQNGTELLFNDFTTLEMVIAGWVDQSILEYHRHMQGDRHCLANLLAELDSYRPHQKR